MAIYDTFLVADPSEKDVLLAKLNIEDALVNHWFIVDSAYSNTGSFKGHHVKNMIADSAFANFRPRITVIEYDQNVFADLVGGGLDGVIPAIYKRFVKFGRHQAHYLKKAVQLKSLTKFLAYFYDESFRDVNRGYMKTETFYRDLTRPLIMDIMSDEDFLFISDVDEILDCETTYCVERIEELALKKSGHANNLMRFVKRKRLWDYHNLDTSSFSYVPLARGSFLRGNPDFKFNLIRQTQNAVTPATMLELVHEYSSCYPMSGLLAKYSYHVDLSFTQVEEILLSLKLNKNLGMPGLKPNGWLEFVPIRDDHQPHYVKNNFDILSTRIVDEDYRKNRIELFPELFLEF